MEEKAIIISVIVSLLIYSIGSSAFFIFATKKAAKNFEEEKEKRRSFEAMAMLFQCLLTDNGNIYSYFDKIEAKKFVYAVREILGNRCLEAFEKLEVHNDLADVYKQGPNWEPLKCYIIEKMRLELAKELYLHYTTLEINNAFKITAHAPEDRIRIAKEISLAVMMKAASKEKGERPALQETAEKIIKEFDLGDDRKTLLMAEVIKIEKGMPV